MALINLDKEENSILKYYKGSFARLQRTFVFIAPIFLCIAFSTTLGCLIWGMNKGLGIWDEGIVLGYVPAQEKIDYLAPFFTIVTKVSGWLNPGIITFRWINLVMMLLSCLGFSLALWEYLKKTLGENKLPIKFVSVFFLTAFSGFFYYTIQPQTLSYNSITNALMLLIGSLVLLVLLKEDREKSLILLGGWAVAGFLMIFECFIKPTAALAFFCTVVILNMLYWWKNRKRYIGFCLTSLMIGGIAGAALYFFIFQNIWNYLEIFKFNASVLFTSNSYHNPWMFSKNYFLEFAELLRFLAPLALPSLLFVIFIKMDFLMSRSPLKRWRQSLILLTFSAVLCLISFVMLIKWGLLKPIHETPRAFFFVFIIVALALINTFLMITIFRQSWSRYFANKKLTQIAMILTFLFVLPITARAGTSSGVISLADMHLAPWMGLIIILLAQIQKIKRLRFCAWAFTLLLVFWMQLKFFYGYLYRPLHLPASLWLQTEKIDSIFPNAKSLKFDVQSKLFYEKLYALLQKVKFQPGDPILGLFGMSGVVYIVGGISPGSPLIFGYQEEIPNTCAYIAHSKVDRSKLIILVSREIPSDLLRCIRECNIQFPEAYAEAGKISNPFKEVLGGNDDIVVYAPKPI